VLKLISITINAGAKLGKSVAVCGEMAGDAKLTKLLIGMGLRQLSMHPSNLLSVKQQILHSQTTKLISNARKVLKHTDLEKIEPLVAKFNL
jgi:phosphotransferase system enzyme I (PtsI)